MPPSVDQLLRKAGRHARNGEAEQAARAYQSVLDKFPENRRALDGLKALQTPGTASGKSGQPEQRLIDTLLALYNRGDYEQALAQATTAADQFPNVALLRNLLGAIQLALGDPAQAEECFREAVRLEPESAEASNNLGAVLNDLGRFAEGAEACQLAVKIRPGYAEAHYNLGNALSGSGQHDKSIESFNRAVKLVPDYVEAWVNLAFELSMMDRAPEAVECCEKALALRPDSAKAHNNLGNARNELGQFELAAAAYSEAIRLQPDFAEAHKNLGSILRHLGRSDEAAASCQAAISADPYFAEAHRNLSALTRYQADDPRIDQLRQLLERDGIPDSDRMHLNFALGKACEDAGHHDEAFACFAEGNRLRKTELNYHQSATQQRLDRVLRAFRDDVPMLDVSTSDATTIPRMIFVVGMPRSGTTLVEQVLASHSEVHGGGELKLMGPAIAATGVLKGSPSRDGLQALRDTYLDGIAGLDVRHPRVTDKMPFNFWWLGFILSAFPDAKIVHLKRDPVATCWSNFKHFFSGRGIGFTNDFHDLADYFHTYTRLMSFWHQRFPGAIYDLGYEALTENQEAETRALLQHVDLEWEDQCLEFHATQRSVRTASATQVRQKMYQGSSEAWRKYEQHLQPLIELLNTA